MLRAAPLVAEVRPQVFVLNWGQEEYLFRTKKVEIDHLMVAKRVGRYSGSPGTALGLCIANSHYC